MPDNELIVSTLVPLFVHRIRSPESPVRALRHYIYEHSHNHDALKENVTYTLVNGIDER